MSEVEKVFLTALGAGVAGWALENALFGPRYSQIFGQDVRVPFLPVYAAGGVALALAAPHLQTLAWPVRGAAYGAMLTGIEGLSGLAERAQGRMSWDYGGGVIDLPHAVAWAALGLLAEPLVT